MKRTEGTWLGISFPGWGPAKRQDSRVLLPLTWCKIRRNIHEETDIRGPKTAPWNDYSPLVAAGTWMDQSRKPEEKYASQQILEWINDANPGLDTSWDIPPSMWTGAVMGKTGIDQYLVSSTGLLWGWVGHACVLGNHICWDFLLLVSRSTVHADRWALRIMISRVGSPLGVDICCMAEWESVMAYSSTVCLYLCWSSRYLKAGTVLTPCILRCSTSAPSRGALPTCPYWSWCSIGRVLTHSSALLWLGPLAHPCRSKWEQKLQESLPLICVPSPLDKCIPPPAPGV